MKRRPMKSSSFRDLSPEEQEAVREAQRKKKLAKLQAKKQTEQKHEEDKAEVPPPRDAALGADLPVVSRCTVTSQEYFAACPGGLFRDPNLPPTAEALALLLRVLNAGDEQARELSSCSYFQFAGNRSADVWDAAFNARLAWEGFFTITTGRGQRNEPLPELQPFYGVLLWSNFAASKHVKRTLATLARERRGYVLSDRVDPERTWRNVEAYHKDQHGTNWLTRRYFNMMKEASEDPTINFTLHCIELGVRNDSEAAGTAETGVAVGSRVRFEGLAGRADLNGTLGIALNEDAVSGRWVIRCDESGEHVRVKPINLCCLLPPPPQPVAGEIGFSVGRVYTSLSGWSGERSTASVGTAQLVLLGKWLQRRRYAFWSLGHCYSPEMDYKRQLGHRIYTRDQFLQLLKKHRGAFELVDGAAVTTSDSCGASGAGDCCQLSAGDQVAENELLEASPGGSATPAEEVQIR